MRLHVKDFVTIAVLTLGIAIAVPFARAQDKPATGPRREKREDKNDDKKKVNKKKDDKQDPAAAPKPGATPAPTAEAPAAKEEEDGGLHSCAKARGKFKVNLKPETELKDLVTWAFSFTCRNFIYDSKISQRTPKVTLMSPEEMTAQQAWRVFLVALQSMQLTVVPKGNVLEIIEYQNAKNAPLPIFTRGKPGATDQMVRVLLRPEHLPVDELARVLTELKSKSGDVKPIPKAGVVMITDFGTNAAKMSSIMLAVDQPVVNERLYLLHVQHADATELVTKLEEILGVKEAATAAEGRRRNVGMPQQPPIQNPDGSIYDPNAGVSASAIEQAIPTKMMADERTNSIILLGGEAAYLRVKSLVKRLDVSIGESEGRIQVYRLEHADSEELSQTLTALISGIQQPADQQGGRRRGRQQQQQQQQQPVPQVPGATGGSAAAFEGQVRVTHDKPTNSLVIVASTGDYRSLREVIQKLDVVRPQVYIEATIVEVNTDNSLRLGTSFHGGKDLGGGALAIGGLQHGQLKSLSPSSLATATGLVGGALGPLLTNAQQLLGTSIPSFGVFIQALADTNNINVLSSPHILTSDNEEAEISVGQNIPYQSTLAALPGLPTGGAGGAAAGLGLVAPSIQRQSIALTLKITPHISSDKDVRLDIDLEIKDIASRNFEGNGPAWSERSIKDTVVVRDQQAVVLGGLMANREEITESKIPLLGDIPVLGYLFKFKIRAKRKSNLLVLLTPYIVQQQVDLERIVERRTREHQEFLRSFSTFANFEYRPDVDYRRKRGLVEEINKAVKRSEDEAAFLKDQEAQDVHLKDGPIEIDATGGDAGEEAVDDSEPASEPASAPAPTAPARAPREEENRP